MQEAIWKENFYLSHSLFLKIKLQKAQINREGIKLQE